MSIELSLTSRLQLYINRFENTISKLVIHSGQEVAGWLTAIGIGGTALVTGCKKLTIRQRQIKEKRKNDKKRDNFIDALPEQLDNITKTLLEIQSQTAAMPKIASEVAFLSALDTLDRERQGILWYRCDHNGVTTEVSEQLSQLFGVTQDMMVKDGTGWLTAVENSTEVYDSWIRSVREKLPYHKDYVITNRHTKKRYLVKSTATRIERSPLNLAVYYGEIEIIEELS